MVDQARGEGRILTVPNLVTTVRVLSIPVFVLLLLRPNRAGWYPAALLLGALGATDWVDGYIARHFKQVSTLGKILDPLADRLLLGVAAIAIIAVGAVPVWVAVVALAREALVAAGFLYVAAAGGRRMDVQWAGKAGTFGLMFALPLFLAGHANDDWHSVAEALAWICVIPALAFGWYAAITYVPMARKALAQSRREREDAPA
ncbi:MAG TPA: CDP-alcohol phosphatidyltransferase family protein [Acidimicrobiales bacterium]|nr:CDP-alcohol phosphatidyltransferase family protein [Acidimicrobiales bacterium]